MTVRPTKRFIGRWSGRCPARFFTVTNWRWPGSINGGFFLRLIPIGNWCFPTCSARAMPRWTNGNFRPIPCWRACCCRRSPRPQDVLLMRKTRSIWPASPVRWNVIASPTAIIRKHSMFWRRNTSKPCHMTSCAGSRCIIGEQMAGNSYFIPSDGTKSTTMVRSVFYRPETPGSTIDWVTGSGRIEGKTSNIQQRTSNIQFFGPLDVECWMFDVSH